MKKIMCADAIFLLTLLVNIFGSLLLTAVVQLLSEAGIPVNSGVVLFINQILLVIPVVILLIAHKSRNPKDSIMDYMRLKRVRIGTILLVIVFSGLIRPLITIVNAFSMFFVKNEVQTAMTTIIDDNNIWLSLFIVGMVPGMLEEFVYRGYFFGTYKRHSFWRGVIISSLVFGMMHLNFNQFGYAAVMGVIMCLLAEATGSIVSGMIMHFCINGSSVLMLWAIPKIIPILKDYLINNLHMTPEQLAEAGLDMDNPLAAEVTKEALVSSIVSLIVPTIICTFLAFLLLYAMACIEKRKDRFLACFRRKDNSQVVEENRLKNDYISPEETQKKEREYPGPVFYIATAICVFIMVASAVYGLRY